MRIYLAGPEVFLREAPLLLKAKKDLCTQYGYEGVSPFDADIGELRNDWDTGIRIAKANEQLIESCQAVIANITPFRGQNADVGTVYEIGYAKGRNLRIFAYSHGKALHAERIAKDLFYDHVKPDNGFYRDSFWGTLIDDFGMVENAMVDGGVHLSGGRVFVKEMRGATIKEQLQSLEGFKLCLDAIKMSLEV